MNDMSNYFKPGDLIIRGKPGSNSISHGRTLHIDNNTIAIDDYDHNHLIYSNEIGFVISAIKDKTTNVIYVMTRKTLGWSYSFWYDFALIHDA